MAMAVIILDKFSSQCSFQFQFQLCWIMMLSFASRSYIFDICRCGANHFDSFTVASDLTTLLNIICNAPVLLDGRPLTGLDLPAESISKMRRDYS